MQVDPLTHVASRFGHALTMLAELVEPSDDRDLPQPIRMACLEAWFTNYRLLIEFLVVGGRKKVMRAQDLAPGWEPASSPWLQRMKQDYGWASEHFVHIGSPKPADPIQNVSPQILRVRASLLLDVVDEFVALLDSQGSPVAGLILAAATNARSILARSP